MVRGICRLSSSSAKAFQLPGYLISYVPNRVALTALHQLIDCECNLLVAGPNILLLMRTAKDMTLCQITNYVHFLLSCHLTRDGYRATARCLHLICGKIRLEILVEANAQDVNVFLHALMIVCHVNRIDNEPQFEKMATWLIDLGASPDEPC